MNRKFQSMLKQQWANRLLALFMCASLLLSSVAARPLAQSYDEAPPTPTSAPVVDTATPEPVSPTQEPATPTEVAATPTEEQASPTAEPPVPTDEPATPTAEPVTPTAEPALPTPTAAAPTQAPTEPVAPVKPAQAVNPKVVSGVNYHQLVIKFKSGYASSLSGQSLSAQSTPGVAPLLDLLQGAPVKPLFSSLKQASSAQMTSQAAQAESVLSRYFVAQLPESTDYAGAQQILDSITAFPFIDTAYMEPIYKAAITPTDDFSGDQGYLGAQDGTAANNGIEASTYAWLLEDDHQKIGRGLDVSIYDIEEGWQIGHEDLPITKSHLLESANTSQQDWVDHGTAVLGVLGAYDDGKGVTGIASDSQLWMVSNVQNDDLTTRSLADAINLAVLDGLPGDIIVLPLEALGPVSEKTANCSDAENASFEDIPVEYWQANFDAISAATVAGFIVVEAAGNGQMNLGADRYNDKFNRDSRDSGAILVGAGTSGVSDDPRLPVCSTNYGSRIDLQGWGEDVVTTGYGDKFDGSPADPVDPNRFYTNSFGGTSAAAAIVAGAAASFQGVAKDRGYTLTPEEVRDALHSTGKAENPGPDPIPAKNIGPLPNLKDAISKKIPETITLLSPPNSSTPLDTLRPTLDWASFYNASSYELEVYKGGVNNRIMDRITNSTDYTFTDALSYGETYNWRVRPMVDSVWQKWSVFFKFVISQDAITVPATTLHSPDDGTVFNNGPADHHTLTWHASTPAVTGYQVQISTASDFPDDPLVTQTILVDAPAVSYDATTLEFNTRYYWRVRCVIAGPPDNYSAWTSIRKVSTALDLVGSLTAPPDGLPIDSLRPEFSWAVVSGAKAYSLQVANNTGFSSSSIKFSVTINIASGDSAPHTYYLMKSDLPRNSILYWRVRDQGKYGWSAYTDYFTFTTGNPPGVPSLGQPSNAKRVTNPDDVVLNWSTPAGAQHFWLQISTTDDFTDFTGGVNDHDATNPFPAALDPNTKYFWRVRAGDVVSTWGNWSGSRYFYTTPRDPENLVAPNPSPTLSLVPKFSWDPVDGASSYRIQVLKYSEPLSSCTTSSVLDKTITSAPPYTLTSPLPRLANLCWRVSAIGLYGTSNWTTDGSEFKTLDPPYAPDLSSPGNGASLATFAPLLDWDNSPNQSTDHPTRTPRMYQVQVSKSSSFPDTLIDTNIANGVTRLQLAVTDLPVAGTYYWRVRACVESDPLQNCDDDLYSAWSSTRSFITPPQFEGTIYDAMDGPGNPVQFVNLQVSGTNWTTTTDNNGEFSFKGLPPGTYDLLISKGNYMRQTRKISVSRGNNLIQDFGIVPIPADNVMRIQLVWGSSVPDMDSNLWLPNINKCLVNELNVDGGIGSGPCQGLGGPANAELVPFHVPGVDDRQTYGTEVITIDSYYATTDNDQYLFAVYLNAAASKMGGSGAKVTVYQGSDLKGTFSVPSSSSGVWWKVFKFKMGATEATVTSLNTVGTKYPGPY